MWFKLERTTSPWPGGKKFFWAPIARGDAFADRVPEVISMRPWPLRIRGEAERPPGRSERKAGKAGQVGERAGDGRWENGDGRWEIGGRVGGNSRGGALESQGDACGQSPWVEGCFRVINRSWPWRRPLRVRSRNRDSMYAGVYTRYGTQAAS